MTLIQKYVRLKQFAYEGHCTCCTCGRTGDWKEFDGGHWISRGWSATSTIEENIHPQCKPCNRFGNGRHDDYTLFMIDMYGEEKVRELNRLKRQGEAPKRAELIDIIADYKGRLRELQWLVE